MEWKDGIVNSELEKCTIERERGMLLGRRRERKETYRRNQRHRVVGNQPKGTRKTTAWLASKQKGEPRCRRNAFICF